MKTIRLHGELGERFGLEHKKDVRTPAEAIRSLCATKRGFYAYLLNSGHRYRVVCGDQEERCADTMGARTGRGTIHIVPAEVGGKNAWFQALTGAALIGAALMFPASSTFLRPFLMSLGATTALGAASRLLASDPAQAESEANRPSYFFSGPVNTTAAGHCIPVLYGEMTVGGAVISASIDSAAYVASSGDEGAAGYILVPRIIYRAAPDDAALSSIAIPLTTRNLPTGTKVWTVEQLTGDALTYTVNASTLTFTDVPMGTYKLLLTLTIDDSDPTINLEYRTTLCVYDVRAGKPEVSGGGGKSGDSPTREVQAPDSLTQTAVASVVYLLSEGPIEGFGSVDREEVEKKVYLNEVPMRDAAGTEAFSRTSLDWRLGLPNQSPMDAYADADPSPTTTHWKVTTSAPWTSPSILAADASKLKLNVFVPALYTVSSQGTRLSHSVALKISVGVGGVYTEWTSDSINGLATQGYSRDYVVPLTNFGAGPWTVKVERTTADGNGTTDVSDIYVETYAELQMVRLTYPNCAVLGLTVDASQFSSVPVVSAKIKGLQIQIPSNYDPIGRTYTGEWDGLFDVAWSDNPAWCMWDLLTSGRYGLGDWIDVASLDKWSFYQIAQRCDEGVNDGTGTSHDEPRFRCNVYLQSADDAYRVLSNFASIFWGKSFWGSNACYVGCDMPADPVAVFSEANVSPEGFTYSTGSDSEKPNTLMMAWSNPDDRSKQKWTCVRDSARILDEGAPRVQSLVAFGAACESEAIRWGKHALEGLANEDELVSFETGFQGITLRPEDIILIQDNARTRKYSGGRMLSSDGTTHQLDGPVIIESGRTYDLLAVLPDGSISKQRVTTSGGTLGFETQTIATTPFPAPIGWMAMWVLQDAISDPAAFKVDGVKELAPERYAVTAHKWDSSKFDRIDAISIPVPHVSKVKVVGPVSDITSSIVYAIEGEVAIYAVLNWTAKAGAAGYQVSWRCNFSAEVFQTTVPAATARLRLVNPGATGQAETYGLLMATITPLGISGSVPAEHAAYYWGRSTEDYIQQSGKYSRTILVSNGQILASDMDVLVDEVIASGKPLKANWTALRDAEAAARAAWEDFSTGAAPYDPPTTTPPFHTAPYDLTGWLDVDDPIPVYQGPGGNAYCYDLWDAYRNANDAVVVLCFRTLSS